MNRFAVAMLVPVVLLLHACRNDETYDPSITGTREGHVVAGALVEGISYSCGAQTGVTGPLGQFTYEPAAGCTFSIGPLSLPASADKLGDGVVTPYDLTANAGNAHTLMRIIHVISHTRAASGLFLVVDRNLAPRLAAVDLAGGDAAVSVALEAFGGSVTPPSVQAAVQFLATMVDSSNQLTQPLAGIVAQAEGVIAQADGIVGETNRPNQVNFKVYDSHGNPYRVVDAGYTSAKSDWLWVTKGQNPNNFIPVVGTTIGDITGPNVFGMHLHVGRNNSESVGTSFKSGAYNPPSPHGFKAPATITANHATNDEPTKAALPQHLNFGFRISLAVTVRGGTSTDIAREFRCENFMVAQSSTKPAWTAYFDVAKDLTETALDGYSGVTEGNSEELEKAAKSFTDLASTLVDEFHFNNYWLITSNVQSESYRIMLKDGTKGGTSAVLMECKSGSVSMPVWVYAGNGDDHTFSMRVAFPDEKDGATSK